MLIDSPRITPDDRAHWQRMEQLDAMYARAHRRRIERMAETARQCIAAFGDQRRGYISVSWGKDSVVVANIALQALPDWPLVWVRVEPIANPDCAMVRDAFLAGRPPGIVYDEITSHCVRGDGKWHASGTLERGFAEAQERYGRAHVSGIRAQESDIRKLRFMRWGESSPHTCAPLSRWKCEDVFAYLWMHGLPVHPAYACTGGGRIWPRDRIRVASLGGERGKTPRRQWEHTYYGDRLREIDALDAAHRAGIRRVD